MLQALDAAAVRRWAAAALDALAGHEDELNKINVFPVADSDTGTNLRLTMRSAFDALVRQPAGGVGAAMTTMAGGALHGARGNSGLVLSQLLRGLADACGDAGAGAHDGADAMSAAQLRAALARSAELANAVFTEPVPGTALSVLDAAAMAAQRCKSGTLTAVADAAVGAAATALARTPSQLPVLARAGVVDAGGQGMLVVLDALVGVIAEREPSSPILAPALPRSADSLRGIRETGSPEYEYEVMYLLGDTSDAQVLALRSVLAGIGDSVGVVSDGNGAWQVHVHCADVGAAIEAGVQAGRPSRITVIRFADQANQAGLAAPARRFARERAVVAVVAGTGAQQLFRGEGATVVSATLTADTAATSDTSDPVAELVAAIAGTKAAHVVVLPNTPAATAAADVAAARARDTGQDVVVVPTASPVQGLAALAVHDPSRRWGDDVVAMAEAAAATRRGELVVAAEEALTWAGRCQPGDVLGLVDGEVVLIAADVTAASWALVGLMLATGGEVVTALLGADAPAELAETLRARLRSTHPEIELTVYDAGQVGSPLLVGVE